MTKTGSESLKRMLAQAQGVGEADAFAGKRGWVRYQADLTVEIRVAEEDAPFEARMHNLSGGGLGFWSQRNLPGGTPIGVRLISKKDSFDWIEAEVVHSSVGIQGHLVGARFGRPTESDTFDQPQEGEAEPARPTRYKPTGFIGLSAAVTLCGFGAILASFGPALIASFGFNAPMWTVQMLTAAACLSLTAIALQMAIASDGRYQRLLSREIARLAKGKHSNESLPDAPSPGTRSLRRAITDLRSGLRRREEEQRQRRQKLEELNLIKSNILSMVSHDLRTPLTSILLYAQMLREDLDTLARADQEQFLEIITHECTRLSRLVDDLLEAQRLQSGRTHWKMQSIDPTKTITNCAEVFRVMTQSKRLKFEVDCPATLPSIEADEDKLAQVLSNLMSNAVKYVPEGGSIKLSVTANRHEILVCVADDGPGIPREQWDQIFDRFSQLSATQYIRDLPGVGLGLYIVKQIVERHSGRVWVDSELGAGSSFYVSLPTSQEDEEDASQIQDDCIASVLICDADPELATKMGQMLRRMRYDVKLAHSACRLLSHLEASDFDVVVTDILLPDMDAGDVIEALTRNQHRTYRTVVHSYAGEGHDLRSRGIDIFVQRPAGAEELAQAIRAALSTDSEGRTVLLVESPTLRSDAMRRLFADRDWVPIVVTKLADADRFLADFPIDLLLITEDLLSREWGELEQLAQRAHTSVAVICNRPRRAQRRIAEQHGICLLSFRSGEEEELVNQIATDGLSVLEATS